MASKRPFAKTGELGGFGSNDENTALENRQLKSKTSGLSVRSQQPKIDNIFRANGNKKAQVRPAFEVFRDEEEPARKKPTPPPRVPLADITLATNSNEKKQRTSDSSCAGSSKSACTQDSGVDVVFINDDMEISSGSPEILGLSDVEEESGVAEEDTQSVSTLSRSEAQLDSQYFREVFYYLREREETVRPNYNVMSKQSEISNGMRAILVDWLSDVCLEYNINVSSLFLTVSIVDRMLSCFDCPKNKLQLIGAGALFIATKIEEIYPPTLAELVYTTADCYSKKQILRAEKLILKQLKFDVCAPCRFWFGTFFAKKLEMSEKVDHLMRYLLELSLMSDRYLLYRPSELGLAALHLANQWLNPMKKDAIDELLNQANILREDINPIMEEMAEQFRKAPKMNHQSIFRKYSCKVHFAVALIEAPSK
ncbi:hypothetical protein L596_024135 [Steinernema carpocapsae]|uniref:Cyclin N-terminal domain-containing protein n=1 Tax=Steinernema carpocapsae TaxID=34508 RepID=A0A4U5MG27_STECR|nr:hypothetical protein L596_024135 [Steinernema carpocapsae]